MGQNDEIRLGFIGAGNIGRVHLETFEKVEGARLYAIADVDGQLAHARAAQFGISKVHESVDALVEDANVDAVVIGVPNRLHAELAIQALAAGKHVLLEKPMALNAEQAKQIVRAHQQAGTVLMIPHQMRWQWVSQEIRRQVEQGAIGRVYFAKTGWLRRKGIPGWGTWFTRKDQAGGGPLIDIGVHMLDLALYLMCNPKPVTVFGSTYAEFGPKKKGIGDWGTPNWDGYFDVEDLASAQIRMEDGSTLTLEVSWPCMQGHRASRLYS